MTIQDLLYDARSLLDDYNSGGVVLAPSETSESDANALRYINMALNEIYPYSRFFKTHIINQILTTEQKQEGKWVPYVLPSDLGDIDSIVIDDSRYSSSTVTRLEGFNTLYISPFFEGELRVIYKPKPQRYTDVSTELPINSPVAEQYMVFYVAAKIAITDLPDYANFFEQKANELKFMSMKAQPASEESIVDVYWRGSSGTIQTY
jgi:hypothetical protein